MPNKMDIHIDSKSFVAMPDVQLLKIQQVWHVFAHINYLQNILKAVFFLVSTVALAPRTNLLRRHIVVFSVLVWLCLLQSCLSPPSQVSWSPDGSLFHGGFFPAVDLSMFGKD